MQNQEVLISQSNKDTDQVAAQDKNKWNILSLIGFRFTFSYLILYCFLILVRDIPVINYLNMWYREFLYSLGVWTGAHVLNLSHTILSVAHNGSGDKTSDYLANLLVLVFALVATLLWSIFDWKRKNYTYFHEWLRLYARLTLGIILLGYGMRKVIKTQFPDPFLWRLIETYGESSPMGLLWTFMGHSTAYSVFTGAIEILAAILLVIPRFTTLGALLSIGTMGNIFMLNMSYDVPVKLLSFNLLIMGVFLLAPEIRRLSNVFILNRDASSLNPPPLFQRRYLNISILVLQIGIFANATGMSIYDGMQSYKTFNTNPPLYGIYAVDEFILDDQVRPPLFTEASRWRRVVFDRFNFFVIVPADGAMERYVIKLDLPHKSIQLTKRLDPKWKSSLTIETPSPETITLNGEMDGKKIQAKLRKLDINSFLLNNRGFHWINEAPFNR